MNAFKNNMVEAVYVIHARRLTDRATHIKAQLGRFKIPFEFIESYDAEALDAEMQNRFGVRDSQLSLISLSCVLKHMEAMRRIAASGHRWALVLEDDVILDKRFDEELGKIVEEAERFDHPCTIQIGSGGNMFVPKRVLQPGKRVYEASEVRAADSYLIGAKAARLRLDWFARNEKIHLPVDHLFNLIDKETGIRFYWTEPTIVEQGSMNGVFRSVIESRSKKPLWGIKLRFWWQRWCRKYIYRLFG
jgi:glycosyl transferase family 25